MSIHAISGKPGGGKTMYSMRLILNELLYGTRVIITNVGVNLDALNEYLQREYPTRSINLFKRMHLIDEDEMGRFFTIRPFPSVGPKLLTKEEWAKGKMPDYSGVSDHGVMYVLDEVHIKFNARAWMLTGQDVIYYLSQHRKLGDTVVWITQAIGNVDKQFRSVTQDYAFIRNLAKERMSYFSLPSVFLRQTFSEPPSGNAKPMETGSFRMDVKGLASLYDTAKGVGIHGTAGADTKEKKKGMPWWVAVILVVAFILLCVKLIPPMVAKAFSPPPVQKKGEQTNASQPSMFAPLPPVKSMGKKPEPQTNSAVAISNSPKVTVDGYHRMFGQWVVMLSDGSEIREQDEKLQQIHPKRGVLYDGKYIPFTKPQAGNSHMAQNYISPDVEGYGPSPRYRVIGPSGKATTITQ